MNKASKKWIEYHHKKFLELLDRLGFSERTKEILLSGTDETNLVNYSKSMEEHGFKRYKKKPIDVWAKQIKEKFEVETMEGIMKGKAGDYLIFGIVGEPYPCDKDIFEKTYDEVK